MKKALSLSLVGLALLAGCSISNETAEAVALKELGNGGKLLYIEHAYEKDLSVTLHVFIGKDQDGILHYIRTVGDKVVKNDPIDQR